MGVDEEWYFPRMTADWESDRAMNPASLLAVLEPEQIAGLDRLFTNARCEKREIDNIDTSSSFEVGNTLTAINALRETPSHNTIFIRIPTTKSIFLSVQQDFHAVFNFALPPERRDYSFLTDGVISIKDNNSVRLHDEREDDIAMFETPTSSGSYLFYVMMRPCYRDGWRGFIIYDTADLALEVVMRSLDSQTYTWPRRFGDETEKLEKRIRNENRSVSDSFVLSFAINLGLQYLKELRNQVKEIEGKIDIANRMTQENQTSGLSKTMLELNKCGDDIRNLRLEHQTTFAFEVVQWMYGDLRLRYQDSEALRLYRMDSKPRTLYSDPLKEKIADVRARIADIAAQQRQEREEQRWHQEQQRWKEREEAEKHKDGEKLERERKRQDVKDTYERDKEQRRAERESKRTKDEEEQRADKLQRQNIRQALEDQRAEDARKLQDLSVKIAGESIKIAEESLRDGQTMRGIAWLTMAFLPATFVSSFFGMNFFNGVPGTPAFDEVGRNVWIFFVVAVPISALVLTGFWFWDRKKAKKVTTVGP
jgi:Mg2+ and Co2+ transporter CorA